jgi:putative ABC transport system permease protein
MENGLQPIALDKLAIIFIPVMAVIAIYYYWAMPYRKALYAQGRMLVQLLLIGYVLAYIFNAKTPYVIILAVTVMLLAAAWIALGTVPEKRWRLLRLSLLAIFLGGGLILLLSTQLTLALEPWYKPRYFIPLAGMIFANAMNSISLGAERLFAELNSGKSFFEARKLAMQTGLIPITNALLAVGLVSLPGVMTGQILSGISPLIAARYQIMIMAMLFAGSGLATAIFLFLVKREVEKMNSISTAKE